MTPKVAQLSYRDLGSDMLHRNFALTLNDNLQFFNIHSIRNLSLKVLFKNVIESLFLKQL